MEYKSKRWRVGQAATVLILVVALWIGPYARPASAVVLVSAPSSQRIWQFETLKAGVWYQEYSGGSRRYVMKVVNPKGRVVKRDAGRATQSRWTYIRHKAWRPGVWKIVYRTGKDLGIRTVYRVRVRALPGE